MQNKTGLYIKIFLALFAIHARISFAQCSDTLSDTTFPGAVVLFSDAQSSPPFPDNGGIEITRVVGPGVSSDFDGAGFLTAEAWNTYVQNGVLSPTAYLGIGGVLVLDVGPHDGDNVAIYINDILVGSYTYPALPECVEISTKYLKFPQRVPGQAPQPAENKVTAIIDFSQDVVADGEAIALGPLTIKAMAPVIMVHGWNSGPWFWGPTPSAASGPSSPDGCGVDPNPTDVTFDFVSAFVSAKVPFNCTASIDPHAKVKTGAAAFEQLIQGNPSSGTVGLAAEFGAQHVHIVGHSLGGWWTRAALPLLQDDNIGVYSVTSIDTPHHGSSLADLLVQAHQYPLLGLVQPKFFLGLLRSTDAAADDLQTSAAAGLNAQYPDPTNLQFPVNGVQNTAQYYSVAADANLNSDSTIESNEWYPYQWTSFDPINSLIANKMYTFLGNIQSVTVSTTTLLGRSIPISPHFAPTPSFQKNDLAVTVNSSQFDGFLPLVPGTSYVGPVPYFLYNHKTVGNSSIAQQLIVLFQNAQAQAQQ